MYRTFQIAAVAVFALFFVGCTSGGGGGSGDTAGVGDTAAEGDAPGGTNDGGTVFDAPGNGGDGGDGGGTTNNPPSGDTSGDGPTSALPDLPPMSDAGTGPEDTAVIPDPEPEFSYPEGPYGKDKFDVIEDLAFFDPWENRWVYLHEFHMDPSKKMLILIAGAGWCGACRLEADDLVGYYDEYEADGLGILYTLYEDNSGKSIFNPGAPSPGDMAFMNSWKNEYDVDYPLVADVGFQLESYFKDSSTPLTIVIRTEDMMIKYIDQGYSSTFLDYQILMNLYN
jgi:thiol-disulfide isomerase/thioredoxin